MDTFGRAVRPASGAGLTRISRQGHGLRGGRRGIDRRSTTRLLAGGDRVAQSGADPAAVAEPADEAPIAHGLAAEGGGRHALALAKPLDRREEPLPLVQDAPESRHVPAMGHARPVCRSSARVEGGAAGQGTRARPGGEGGLAPAAAAPRILAPPRAGSQRRARNPSRGCAGLTLPSAELIRRGAGQLANTRSQIMRTMPSLGATAAPTPGVPIARKLRKTR